MELYYSILYKKELCSADKWPSWKWNKFRLSNFVDDNSTLDNHKEVCSGRPVGARWMNEDLCPSLIQYAREHVCPELVAQWGARMSTESSCLSGLMAQMNVSYLLVIFFLLPCLFIFKFDRKHWTYILFTSGVNTTLLSQAEECATKKAQWTFKVA